MPLRHGYLCPLCFVLWHTVGQNRLLRRSTEQSEAADDGLNTAEKLHSLLSRDRQQLLNQSGVTISAIRLLDQLPSHPIVTLGRVTKILKTTKPTATKAIECLRKAKILFETTDRRHDRRPLKNSEFTVLLEAANNGRIVQQLSGKDRAVLYAVAAYTRLRASELASLTIESFSLDGEPSNRFEPRLRKRRQ